MQKFFQTTAISVLAIGLFAASASGETYDSEGKGMGMNTNEVYGISDGHAVVKTQTNYDSFEVPSGHPLEGATGACFGALLINAGAASGTGNCVFDTASGDKAVLSWVAKGLGADGALTGDWTVSGGTGGWGTASGSGTFSSLTDPETKTFVNTITGSITMN